MKIQAGMLILVCVIGLGAYADSNDIEDLSKEADAAIAADKAAQKNLAQEKATTEQTHKAADDAAKAAQATKENAVEDMKKNDAEIQSLTTEQNKIREDILRMKKETAVSSKTLAESKAKLEKARQELATLQQLRMETNKKMLEIAAETDKVTLELKGLDYGKAHAVSEFQQLKEDTKKNGERLDKLKEDLTQKRAQSAIAGGQPAAAAAAAKAPAAAAKPAPAAATATAPVQAPASAAVAATPAPAAAPVTDTTNAITGAVAAATSSTPQPMQREITSAGNEMVFKRDCKVYDRVTQGPQIIGTKTNGSTITKTDETRYWIGFSMSPTQKGFVAKTCF